MNALQHGFAPASLAASDEELLALLREDVPYGDLTTQRAGIEAMPARMIFRARQEMVVCATEEAARLSELCGAEVVRWLPSGLHAEKGGVLLEVTGTAGMLHRVWKSAQVLVEWASGISTATAQMVRLATPLPVVCTRKSVPGTRRMSSKAVRAGGGGLHRLGLSESLLLFAEHRGFMAAMPTGIVDGYHSMEPEKKLVVEVSNLAEALLWARAGADVVQLEKFTPAQVEECCRCLRGLGTRIA
ncbi:MAG: ModD protein, partial [Sideroxydans sp.]|nr:ModD protein [Sideroxydans sp.]